MFVIFYVFSSCQVIHSVFRLTTGPKPPPKRFLHIMRSRASSFKWQYPLLSLRSSSSFLRLLPRLLVISISPFIFSSITCFRRQFLRKMWPIQLAFRFLISCRIFLCSLTPCQVCYKKYVKLFVLHLVTWCSVFVTFAIASTLQCVYQGMRYVYTVCKERQKEKARRIIDKQSIFFHIVPIRPWWLLSIFILILHSAEKYTYPFETRWLLMQTPTNNPEVKMSAVFPTRRISVFCDSYKKQPVLKPVLKDSTRLLILSINIHCVLWEINQTL